MQTVLIAGANGFIGRNLCVHFLSSGWCVRGIDIAPPANELCLPVADYAQAFLPSAEAEAFFQRVVPTVVVQAAGTADVSASMREPFADFQASVPGTAFLLDCIRKHAPAARFIYLSSAAVYGNPEAMPVCESLVPKPLSAYGWHKLAGETLCREYATLFGVKTIALRVFSAYGQGLRRQVLWDICNKLVQTDKVTLHGTGEETRDFLHVDDLARAAVMISTADLGNTQVLNLASGSSTGIQKLAALLRDKLSPGAKIEFSGHCLPGYPSQWSADISKVGALGFTPGVPIEVGIAGYVDWFRSLRQ